MTISTDGNRIEYTGNGVTTAFSYPYKFLADSDLVVIETVIATGVSTTKTLNTDYTVSGAGGAGGGTVTAVTAPAGTVTWMIYGDPAITQSTDLTDNDKLPANSLENMADRLTLIAQRARDMANRSLRLPEGDTGFTAGDVEIPAKIVRAGMYLAFDAAGKATASSGTGNDTALRTDLAASDGSSLTGFIQSGTGAVATNLQARNQTYIDVVNDFGAVGDGTADDTTAIKNAITAALALNIGLIVFPWGASGIYKCTGSVVDGTAVYGLKFVAIGRQGSNTSYQGVTIQYTGAGVWFHPVVLSGTYGTLEFDGFYLSATNVAGTLFDINDPVSGTFAGTGHYRGVKFRNCALEGASGGVSQTGDGIRVLNVFQLDFDHTCSVRFFRRNIWLKDSDNNRVSGRSLYGCRNIMIESTGAAGNDNVVDARYLGITDSAGSESLYQIWDNANNTIYVGNALTDTTSLGGVLTAHMYLDGNSTRIVKPHIGSGTIPLFEYGGSGYDIIIDQPVLTTNADKTPIYSASPTSWDYVGSNAFYGIIIRNASSHILAYLNPHPQLRLDPFLPFQLSTSLFDISDYKITANGMAQTKFVLTPFNYWGTTVGTGKQPISGIVEDTGGFYGYAIKLTTTNNSGFVAYLTVGKHLNTGDAIKITVYYRMSGTPSAGTLRYQFRQNGVNISNTALTNSATYASQTATYTLSGFSAGDTFEVAIYNGGADVNLFVAMLIVEVTTAAV